MNIENTMAALYDELEAAANKYYNGLDSGMDDSVYDNRYDYLCSLELRYPQFVRHGSITERVGAKPLSSLPVVHYDKPALSLEKKYDITEIKDYFTSHNANIVNASVKCDGLTVLFTYISGKLVQACSRGGGLEGNDLTRQAMYLPDEDIPKEIPYTAGKVVVRAEVMLPQHMLAIINAQLENGELPYKSCRNLASGTIRNLNPTLTASRQLTARTFQVVTHEGLDFSTHTEELQFAEEQGFRIVPNEVISENDIDRYRDKIKEQRSSLGFDIDGLVFVIDDLELQHKVPDTVKTQGGKMAYKFPNKGTTTYVRSIAWQIGSTGKLTPVLNVDPVEFEGATVCRCTAHNLSFVLGNRESEEIAPAIGIGSQIRLERAGEVIPKCGEVYYTEDVQPLEYPSVCPVCHSATYVDGVDLCCSNADCPGVLKKQLETFSSKPCFNLKGFGEQTISAMVDCGIIKNFPDVFDIWQHKEQLLNVDGFGVKSFDSICMQLKNCCQADLPNVIASLPIKGIGITYGRLLAARFKNLDEFIQFDGNYDEIDGIGPVLNKNIKGFLKSPKGVSTIAVYFINNIGTVNTCYDDFNSSDSQPLTGLTIVITGTLSQSREHFQKLITSNGGKATSSVSKNTDYLLAGENVGATKLAKSKELGVKIISENDLMDMI